MGPNLHGDGAIWMPSNYLNRIYSFFNFIFNTKSTRDNDGQTFGATLPKSAAVRLHIFSTIFAPSGLNIYLILLFFSMEIWWLISVILIIVMIRDLSFKKKKKNENRKKDK